MTPIANAHAIVIGIATYTQLNKLPRAVLADAQDIHDLLIDPTRCGYPPGHVHLLLDSQATQGAVRQALADLAASSTPDGTVFIYVSSHGGRIESGPCAGEYLLPVDAVFTSAKSLAQTAISGADFTEALRRIPARKVLVVFDCCHAGGIGQPKDVRAPEITALPESYYDTLKAGRGRVILAASRSDEASWILPGARNSLFTRHLLDGLRGAAPGPGGVIRVFDLFNYVQGKVAADQPAQHPLFKAELEDNFPVALYLGGKAPATPEALPREDSFVYDVFLSYSHREPDKSWVRQQLAPRLKSAGIRVCIDYRDFRLGASMVEEMQRAVEQSRYSLAVLTPAYLQSNFAEFENSLAQHLGLEKGQRRLLAVMRDECTPKLRMRAQLWLDMTEDSEFEVNVQRLIYEVRQRPEK